MSVWNELPQSRRAAVLLLLFKSNPNDNYRIVLTQRSKNMDSFAGHVAFPGGKSDPEDGDGDVGAYNTARREAHEEIGLSKNVKLQSQGILATYLSRNLLGVKPVIMCLPTDKEYDLDENGLPTILNLHPVSKDEVSSVFSLVVKDILNAKAHPNWYSYKESNWGGLSHILNYFDLGQGRIVWGLTARILIDLARSLYPSTSVSVHAIDHKGDELLISLLLQKNALPPVRDKKRDLEFRFDSVISEDVLSRL